MALVTVVKILKETNKAALAILYCEYADRWTTTWLPKSICHEIMKPYWDIPDWKAADILGNNTWHRAKQYVDDRFGEEGVECYAYGSSNLGFYNVEGKEIPEKDLTDP